MASRWFGTLAGVLLGTVTAVVEFGYLALSLLGAALVSVRGPHQKVLSDSIDRAAMTLTDVELRRVARFHGPVHIDVLTPRRSRQYLAARWLVGGLGGGVFLMLLLFLTVAASMVTAWVFDGWWGLIENSSGRVDSRLITIAALPGTLLIFAAVAGVSGVGTLDRWLATHLLGQSAQLLLQRRVAELTSTRDQVVDAINDERRRIERDLHDGVQQRLVALGMLIGRARRSTHPEQLHELLQQAHLASQDAIHDLREVASRIYPIALDNAGLHAALESLAASSSLRIRLNYELAERPRAALETVIYFVVSEAVNNASKHARPTLVEVSVTHRQGRLLAAVTDDGIGGADPMGAGLSGLARRVAAVDGTLTVRSPPGGPTVIAASLPCG